jgi:alanyl-tRNA synthetase
MIMDKVIKLQKDLRDIKKELEQSRKESLASTMDDLVNQISLENGMYLFTAVLQNVSQDMMREMGDKVKAGRKGSIVVLASAGEKGQVSLVAMADKAAVEAGAHAGDLVREISREVRGGGGGRPGIAQAGGKDASGIPKALEKALDVIRVQLNLS